MRQNPDRPNVRAVFPSESRISVDVKKTIAATGIRMTAIVRNCRFR